MNQPAEWHFLPGRLLHSHCTTLPSGGIPSGSYTDILCEINPKIDFIKNLFCYNSPILLKESSSMASSLHENTLGQFTHQTDVGPVHPTGSCAYNIEQQSYTITGAGANIGWNQDSFHFVWRRLRGDFILTARATFLGAGDNPHLRVGWMARTSLDAGSPHVSATITVIGLPSLEFRRMPGAQTEEIKVDLNGADVIQLERKGNTYIMSVARFGQPFVAVQVSDIDLGGEVYIGLFVCSHEGDSLAQATFQDVRFVKPVEGDFVRERGPFGSHLEILDISTGHRRIVLSADHVFEAPNWTRDGSALIYNCGGLLYRFDLPAGTPSLLDTGQAVRNNNDHVLSSDGSMLAISNHDPEDDLARVYTVPIQGGIPKIITSLGPSYLHGWSPDGRFLVYTGERNGQFDIYRISVEGGEEVQLTSSVGLDDGPEYTPDGRYIYFNSVRSGSMQIWRMEPDGSQPEQMTDDACNNWFPHISPDGKWVVFVSYLPGEVEPGDHPPAKRVYLRLMPLDGGTPKVLAYLYGGQGSMNVPSWSPDSRQLAFVSNTVPFQGS
jgi:TolB protein